VIQVRNDLCIGCGLCLDSCLMGAISLVCGQAEISEGRCNQCLACIDVCPQYAIVALTPMSWGEIEASVAALKSKADDVLARIDTLLRKQRAAIKDRCKS